LVTTEQMRQRVEQLRREQVTLAASISALRMSEASPDSQRRMRELNRLASINRLRLIDAEEALADALAEADQIGRTKS